MIRTKNGLMCIACVLLTAILLLLTAGGEAYAQENDPSGMSDLNDSASYAIGMNYASSEVIPALQRLSEQGMELNRELVAAAIADMIIEGSQPVLSDSIAQMTLVAFQQRHIDAISKQVLALGEKFLAENAKEEGVKTTVSGLQYVVIREGEGASPGPTDSVRVRYRGFLIDGRSFDERMDSTGITFRLNGVIPGWTEGLQLMKEGAQYRFFVPSRLAYGERSVGKMIRPNETLIFDVELLEVKSEE